MSKLAIVIPYYKIDFFEKTIQSLAVQTSKNFTLYIGNDASPDDPLPVILKYFKKEEFNYYPYQDNLGGKNLALQWERILENVSEEWFQILGDDDMISENFVEEFYRNLSSAKSKNITAIKICHSIIDDNKVVLHRVCPDENIIASAELFKNKYKGLMPSSLSENIFQRESYLKFKFIKIPHAWGADDYAILCFANFGNILYILTANVTVRISNISISGNKSLQLQKDLGYHQMRQKVLNQHSAVFDKSFVIRMLNDHFRFSEKNLMAPKINLFRILLLRGYPIRFFTFLKAVFLIRKKIIFSKK